MPQTSVIGSCSPYLVPNFWTVVAPLEWWWSQQGHYIVRYEIKCKKLFYDDCFNDTLTWRDTRSVCVMLSCDFVCVFFFKMCICRVLTDMAVYVFRNPLNQMQHSRRRRYPTVFIRMSETKMDGLYHTIRQYRCFEWKRRVRALKRHIYEKFTLSDVCYPRVTDDASVDGSRRWCGACGGRMLVKTLTVYGRVRFVSSPSEQMDDDRRNLLRIFCGFWHFFVWNRFIPASHEIGSVCTGCVWRGQCREFLDHLGLLEKQYFKLSYRETVHS